MCQDSGDPSHPFLALGRGPMDLEKKRHFDKNWEFCFLLYVQSHEQKTRVPVYCYY